MSNIDSKARETETRSANRDIHSGREKWGQPPASHYVFRLEGNVVYGSILAVSTSSVVPSKQIDSSIYAIVEAPLARTEVVGDDAAGEIVELATLAEINDLSEYLLKKNAELYHRLAQ